MNDTQTSKPLAPPRLWSDSEMWEFSKLTVDALTTTPNLTQEQLNELAVMYNEALKLRYNVPRFMA